MLPSLRRQTKRRLAAARTQPSHAFALVYSHRCLSAGRCAMCCVVPILICFKRIVRPLPMGGPKTQFPHQIESNSIRFFKKRSIRFTSFLRFKTGP